MSDLTGYCIFCEDIRQEVGGTVSLMGVLPHGISVPQLPFDLGNLCLFVRLHLPLHWASGPIQTVLVFPDGSERVVGVVEPEGVLTAAGQMPLDREYIEVSINASLKTELTAVGYLKAYSVYENKRIEMAKLHVALI